MTLRMLKRNPHRPDGLFRLLTDIRSRCDTVARLIEDSIEFGKLGDAPVCGGPIVPCAPCIGGIARLSQAGLSVQSDTLERAPPAQSARAVERCRENYLTSDRQFIPRQTGEAGVRGLELEADDEPPMARRWSTGGLAGSRF